MALSDRVMFKACFFFLLFGVCLFVLSLNLGQLRVFVIYIPRDCPSISEYHVLFMVLDNCCLFSVKVPLDSW